MVDNVFPSKLPAIIINTDKDSTKSLKSQLPMKTIDLDRVQGNSIEINDPKIVGSVAYDTIIKGAKNLYEYGSLEQVADTLTHLKAWYAILDSGAPAAWVFSDKIAIPSGFFDKVDVAYKMYPLMDAYSQWDLWLFNYDGILESTPAPVFGKEMILVEGFRGMYAYMITRGAILKLLPHILPTQTNIDHFISTTIGQYAINVIAVKGIQVQPAATTVPAMFESFKYKSKKSKKGSKTARRAIIGTVVVICLYLIAENSGMIKKK